MKLPHLHRPPFRRSLLLAAALVPAAATARSIIVSNLPGTAPNGGTNTNVPATFGDNIADSIDGIFTATAGADGTVGTPNIDLTWGATASPLGATNANAWQFHAWGGATAANSGGGVLQLDGSRTGSKFTILFSPAANATVKLNSFNLIGDTNGDSYQYRVSVIRTTDSAVVFTTDTALWTTDTTKNPTNTDPPTWTGAPSVGINYTGAQGIAYRLEIERLDDDSALTGSRVDIAIDNLDFDQLTTLQNDVVWTGKLSSAWAAGPQATPKNWILGSGAATDFGTADFVTFDDSSSNKTVDISGADVQPGTLVFANDLSAYTLTGTHGISGTIDLLKNGMGSLTLSNPNPFTGHTYLDVGALVINHPLALQNSTLEGSFGASTHTFGTITAATLGGLGGSADLRLENSASAPVALTVGTNNASTSFSGEISGSGSLLKTGTGRLDLNYDNTFTGGITVAAGSLRALTPAAFPPGPLVSTGGTLEFGIATGVETVISNPIVLPTTGTADLRMFGVFDAGGAAPTPGTTVRLTGKISGGVAGRNFYFSDTGLSGEHDNVLVFDNPTNDFTGTIFLNRATIAITSDAAFGNPDNDITHYSENLNGKIRFDAEGITLNPLRAITLPGTANNRPFDTQSFTATIAGPIAGTGILVKQGSGTLVVTSPDSTFTGPVTLSAGTLRLTGTLPASTSVVTAAAGATLTGTGTVQRPVTLTGGAVSPGDGAGTLHGITALTLGAAAIYEFDVADWTGAPGTGSDTLAVESLAITADGTTPVVVKVTPRSLANFTDTARTFTLVSTTAGITGFTPEAFTVDASALPQAAGLQWSVKVSGKTLVLAYGTAVSSPFDTWATAMGLSGANAAFTADPDGDGLSNGLEFLLGTQPNPANPGAGSLANLPVASRDAATGDLLFTFRRMDAAAALTVAVEAASSPAGGWSTDGVVMGAPVPQGGGVSLVTARVPAARAVGGKIFARLTVTP